MIDRRQPRSFTLQNHRKHNHHPLQILLSSYTLLPDHGDAQPVSPPTTISSTIYHHCLKKLMGSFK